MGRPETGQPTSPALLCRRLPGTPEQVSHKASKARQADGKAMARPQERSNREDVKNQRRHQIIPPDQSQPKAFPGDRPEQLNRPAVKAHVRRKMDQERQLQPGPQRPEGAEPENGSAGSQEGWT